MESRRSDDSIHRVTFEEPHLHGILILRNFFSHEECDRLKSESHDWAEHIATVVTDPGKPNEKHSKEYEKLRKGHIRHWNLEQNGLTWFHSTLHKAALTYHDMFPDGPAFNLKRPRMSVEVACYTNKGDHFAPHQDMYIRSEHLRDKIASRQTRKLSMSCLLSDPDEYSGGHLNMMAHKGVVNTMPLSKGDICLFPSYQVHQVTQLKGGERYALVCWVTGDFWR